eukprot:TRINITY_DN1036_c0_g1_i2.p1 TRINITY_DN1036_c0_g1~~TRINITY_DN1036_c0_g1_i2.p1  ORF type:complete len:454 (-),score=70.64 TRINITY_DN1036_c0_g1_i2:369-1730(-)
MHKQYILLFTLTLLLGVNSLTVWPAPASITQGVNVLSLDQSSFTIDTNSSSSVFAAAIDRYLTGGLIFPFPNSEFQGGEELAHLYIGVGSESEDLQLFVDESYNLEVGSKNGEGYANLTAATIYGAMRGLETFSQLVDYNYTSNTYAINCSPTVVYDSPRFPWRGLLIDSSRHFLSPSTIYRTIDALSYSKFNTLHWHITDAESFPLEIESYPLLSQKGAWSPNFVYNQSFVQDVVSYAQQRGVRVLPEFDMPGHAYSWGLGYPNITASCPAYEANIDNIPFNPTVQQTYDVISGVVSQYSQVFTDNYWHIGGDEVITGCWSLDPSIASWMASHNIKTTTQLLQYFENNLEPIITQNNRTSVCWEDLFDNGITLPSSVIVEAWSKPDTLKQIVQAGLRGITSYGYYLNNQSPLTGVYVGQWENTWQTMYTNDPTSALNLSPSELQLVLGGEAA